MVSHPDEGARFLPIPALTQHGENFVIDRRQLLAVVAGSGLGTPVFHRALTGLIQEEAESTDIAPVTSQMVRTAEWISGTEFSEEEREAIASSVNQSAAGWQKLREQSLEFEDLPALHFQPLSGTPRRIYPVQRSVDLVEASTIDLPDQEAEVAFLPVSELASLIRRRKISSMELTRIYLQRLEKYNPLLNCVVTRTDELALKQAEKADREIAAGQYRGPLHGIPWGAKDLIAVPGYPTSWGIPQFENRELPYMATVARRLEEAGAVLVAKLSLGAIAMGDRWFRGMTRSPWNYELGSSGSSAGSASATVAGLVGFSLGSETLGSIVSPSRRCGATGLRPTFGRVSRAGCMPLSWTMDKIGPICRSAEDCALVFAAIHGHDGLDPTAHTWPFEWPQPDAFGGLKVGYMKQNRRRRRNAEPDNQDKSPTSRPDLEILERLGCELVEVELPAEQGEWVLANTIDVEAASIFDEMLRSGRTAGWNTWPATFREAQFTSAIDYFRIQRHRRRLQRRFEELMGTVDFLVNCNDLLITNLTGHPCVVMPTDYREVQGNLVPQSTVITGQLNDDARLVAFSRLYQNQVTAHLRRPPLDAMLAAKIQAEKARVEKEASEAVEDGAANGKNSTEASDGW